MLVRKIFFDYAYVSAENFLTSPPPPPPPPPLAKFSGKIGATAGVKILGIVCKNVTPPPPPPQCRWLRDVSG